MNGSPLTLFPLQQTPSNTNCANSLDVSIVTSRRNHRNLFFVSSKNLRVLEQNLIHDFVQRKSHYKYRNCSHLNRSGQHNEMLNGLNKHSWLCFDQPYGTNCLLLSTVLGALPIPIQINKALSSHVNV